MFLFSNFVPEHYATKRRKTTTARVSHTTDRPAAGCRRRRRVYRPHFSAARTHARTGRGRATRRYGGDDGAVRNNNNNYETSAANGSHAKIPCRRDRMGRVRYYVYCV